MLLGFYELEILDLIDRISKSKKFDTLIHIGAADGYYGVGVLINNLFQHSYCFETRELGQEIIRKNAEINGVSDRISIFGRATNGFDKLLRKEHLSRSVVLVDIEGGEFELLNKDVFRNFQQSIFIIEIHGWIENADKKIIKLKEDAAAFFTITEMKTSARDLSKFDELRDYTDTDRWLLCSEGRPNLMSWYVLSPRNKPSSPQS